MLSNRTCALLLVFALIACGCKPEPETPPMPDPEVPSAGTAVTAEPPTAAPRGQTESPMPDSETGNVELQVLSWEETLALAQQNRGKVVVMDLWSTRCPPCIEEFPNLVRLHRQRSDEVTCLSVSLDFDGITDEPVESHRQRVMSFLTKQGATFDNILLSTDAETLFSEKIEHNSMPVVFVFDQQGELAGQFPDPKDPAEFTYQEHVLPLVEKLLAER